jgi:hypothetical protein
MRAFFRQSSMVVVLGSPGGRWRVQNDVEGASWRAAVDLLRRIAAEHQTSVVVARNRTPTINVDVADPPQSPQRTLLA